jgi:hypothetical protein
VDKGLLNDPAVVEETEVAILSIIER